MTINAAEIDPRVESLYHELAELEDRWDMTEGQKTTARTQLLWSVVVLKRRRHSLLANGGLANALLSQVVPVVATAYRSTPQRFGLD